LTLDQGKGGAPLIVTALLGAEDFQWLDSLRRAHFPPERNVISAHLTLFHHLPPSLLGELKERLRSATFEPPPPATLSGIMSLGRGTAFRVHAPELARTRDDLAEAFAPLLIPQDAQGWRPHITIQNKVTPETARALQRELEAGFKPRPLAITGLAAWHYRDGPWDYAFGSAFGGGRPMNAPRPFIAG
jgi:hypothetical protein